MWADASEKANGISRDRRTNTLCLTMDVQEGGQSLWNYSMREDSPALLESGFYQLVNKALAEHLHGKQAAPGSCQTSQNTKGKPLTKACAAGAQP